MTKPLIINFTPTGMVPGKNDTPHIPVTPSEIVEQVHEAYDLGITMVHLHARDKTGAPSHKTKDYAPIVEGIRKHCPKLILGLSLSGRKVSEVEQRAEPLELKPDMGSLTLSSLNFPGTASVNSPDTITGLLERMYDLGVRPELEVFDSGMVNYANFLVKKGLLTGPLYFNILLGNLFNQQADMAQAGLLLKDLPDEALWSMAGIGREQLKVNTWAISTGGGVRVGLEDNIWFDTKRQKLASNLDLLKRVHHIAQVFERPILKPEDMGVKGFYNRERQAQ